MRTTGVVFACLLVVAFVQAYPQNQENVESKLAAYAESQNGAEEGSSTWSAIKNLFSPVKNWFTEQLPTKTPSELGTDIKETAIDARNWVQENEAVKKMMTALQPVKNWLKDTADTIKDKTFQELYDDAKVSVQKMDENVGNWINQRME